MKILANNKILTFLLMFLLFFNFCNLCAYADNVESEITENESQSEDLWQNIQDVLSGDTDLSFNMSVTGSVTEPEDSTPLKERFSNFVVDSFKSLINFIWTLIKDNFFLLAVLFVLLIIYNFKNRLKK